MKTTKLLIVVFALLSGLLTAAFRAIPAPISEPARDDAALACYQAQVAANQVDIPARRVDYQVLERAAGCAKVSDLKLVPVTSGESDAYMDPIFKRFKDRQQQERMGPGASLSPSQAHIDAVIATRGTVLQAAAQPAAAASPSRAFVEEVNATRGAVLLKTHALTAAAPSSRAFIEEVNATRGAVLLRTQPLTTAASSSRAFIEEVNATRGAVLLRTAAPFAGMVIPATGSLPVNGGD